MHSYDEVAVENTSVTFSNINLENTQKVGLTGMKFYEFGSATVSDNEVTVDNVVTNSGSRSLVGADFEVETIDSSRIVAQGNTLQILDSTFTDLDDVATVHSYQEGEALNAYMSGNELTLDQVTLTASNVERIDLLGACIEQSDEESPQEDSSATAKISGTWVDIKDVKVEKPDSINSSIWAAAVVQEYPDVQEATVEFNVLSLENTSGLNGIYSAAIYQEEGTDLQARVSSNQVMVRDNGTAKESDFAEVFAVYIDQSSTKSNAELLAEALDNVVTIESISTISEVRATFIRQSAQDNAKLKASAQGVTLTITDVDTVLSKNSAEVIGGNIQQSGGQEQFGDASNNVVLIDNVDDLQTDAYGGAVTQSGASTSLAVATSNQVMISNTNFKNSVIGASVYFKVDGNQLYDSTRADQIKGIADNNLVIVSHAVGQNNDFVGGGELFNYLSGSASGNTVVVSDSTVNEVIVGSVALQYSGLTLEEVWASGNYQISNNSLYLHNAKVSKAAAGSLGYYDEDFNSLSTLDIQGANNTVYVSGVNCVGTLYGFDTLVLTADRETNSEDAVLTLGQTETTREIQTLSNDSLFEGKTLVLRGELEGVNFLEAAEGNSYQFKNSLLRYESAFFESEVALDNFEVSNDQGLDSSRDIVTELKQNLSLTRASATLSLSIAFGGDRICHAGS